MNENLQLPGNPRYQPADLIPIFGYDNLYKPWGQIELAKLEVMKEISMIPASAWETLTDEQVKMILNIKTSATDKVEREITKHDVDAHKKLMKGILDPALARFIHLPLTSYDKINTGQVMLFRQAFGVIEPKIKALISDLSDLTELFASELQIGRTHGQHAIPITVGFWFATLLFRVTYNYLKMKQSVDELYGKITGAVGACNAQVALGFEKPGDEKTFEARVLEKLNLKPAMISTQILTPESVAYFLFSATMLSAALGQLGRDGRQLMRTEIGELAEGFSSTQTGSSTMAHKRNPINFENTEGMWIKNKNEFGKVMDTLISEHQRDLVNSSVMRDFPIILVNLMCQLNTLLRKGGEDKSSFIKRVKFDHGNLDNNFRMNANLIMAEPIYISLQLAGYEGDAHHLVNHVLTPISQKMRIPLGKALFHHLEESPDEDLPRAVKAIPSEIFALFDHPQKYTGKAKEKAMEVAGWARQQIAG